MCDLNSSHYMYLSSCGSATQLVKRHGINLGAVCSYLGSQLPRVFPSVHVSDEESDDEFALQLRKTLENFR